MSYGGLVEISCLHQFDAPDLSTPIDIEPPGVNIQSALTTHVHFCAEEQSNQLGYGWLDDAWLPNTLVVTPM